MPATPHVELIDAAGRLRLEERIRTVEARTGAEVVVALVARCDAFHGLRWRAFAFGASFAALIVVIADALRPDWVTAHTAMATAIAVIGSGLVLALAATHLPVFERLFLQYSRAHAAVNQRARLLFFERDLAATPRRNAVLLLAGGFERVMALVADSGYRGRCDDGDWQGVVDAATPGMAVGDTVGAFIAGLDALETLLVAKGFAAPADAGNALADAPIEIDERR